MRMKLTGAAFALCAGLLASANGQTTNIINQDIAVDTTWSNNATYVLNGAIFVTNGATLYIEPGTLIRAVQDGNVIVGSTNPAPGTLIISRGSKIMANGTKDQPIVFTNLEDDHFVGPNPQAGTAPWNTLNNGISRTAGGVILLGNTYLTHTDPVATGTRTVQIEGLQPYGAASTYGGNNDDDNSGEMSYWSIRYGGYVLGADNEINGLTLGAVGSQTKIKHIEVFQNKDDGFEWFGGTVNTKYLVSWCNADDSFDWDEGFRGKGQFWLAVQGPLSSQNDASDKGVEADGANKGDGNTPNACPTIYNATFIGLGNQATNLNRLGNTVVHQRDSSAGRFYNSMFLDFAGAAGLIEGAIGGSADSADFTVSNYVNTAFYTHEAGGKMLEYKNNVYWNINTNYFPGFAAVSNNGSVAFHGTSGDAGKAHLAYGVFSDASLENVYLADGGVYPYGDANNLPIRDIVRTSHPDFGSGSDVTFSGNTYHPIEIVDPRLTTNTTVLAQLPAPRTPPVDGFYAPVGLIGAFGTRNWASWTLADKQGMLDLLDAVEEDYSADEQLPPEITDALTTYTVSFPTQSGVEYNVEWADNVNGPWETLASVTATETTTYVYTDTRPMITERYYRLTTPPAFIVP